MIGRFNMATLEPPDDAAWHLAVDHYETSGDMDEDALDWLSDADCDDEQKDELAAVDAEHQARLLIIRTGSRGRSLARGLVEHDHPGVPQQQPGDLGADDTAPEQRDAQGAHGRLRLRHGIPLSATAGSS